jgi:hypothetical protein
MPGWSSTMGVLFGGKKLVGIAGRWPYAIEIPSQLTVVVGSIRISGVNSGEMKENLRRCSKSLKKFLHREMRCQFMNFFSQQETIVLNWSKTKDGRLRHNRGWLIASKYSSEKKCHSWCLRIAGILLVLHVELRFTVCDFLILGSYINFL